LNRFNTNQSKFRRGEGEGRREGIRKAIKGKEDEVGKCKMSSSGEIKESRGKHQITHNPETSKVK
jgi:hypothetical protein